MKVIFTKEVTGVAEANIVREVADGFALNYLLPRGLAVRATPEKVQALSQKQVATKKSQNDQQAKALSLAREINGRSIMIECPVSSTGTLYAAVSVQMIIVAIKEQLQVQILPSQIIVPPHIKNIGQYELQFSLAPSAKAVVYLQLKGI